MSRKLTLSACLLVASILLIGCAGRSTSRASAAPKSQTYSAEAQKGAWLYMEYACVQCHGIGGAGASLIRGSGPSLTSSDFKSAFPKEEMYDEALVNIIRNGLIRENDRPASMPAWNGILSEEDIRNIVAYIRAGLPDLGVPLPPAKTGEQIYKAFACNKCHGPLGTGGIRNVAAVDPAHQVIPALGGPSFKERVTSKDELRKHLLNGKFVEDGRTGVLYAPAWGRIGTAEQIEKVVDYIWEY